MQVTRDPLVSISTERREHPRMWVSMNCLMSSRDGSIQISRGGLRSSG